LFGFFHRIGAGTWHYQIEKPMDGSMFTKTRLVRGSTKVKEKLIKQKIKCAKQSQLLD